MAKTNKPATATATATAKAAGKTVSVSAVVVDAIVGVVQYENQFHGTRGDEYKKLAVAIAKEGKPLLLVFLAVAEKMGALDSWAAPKDKPRSLAGIMTLKGDSPLLPLRRFYNWLSVSAGDGKTFISDGMLAVNPKGELRTFPKAQRAPSQPKAGTKAAAKKTDAKKGAPANPDRVEIAPDKKGLILETLARVDAMRTIYNRQSDLLVVGQLCDLLNVLLGDCDVA